MNDSLVIGNKIDFIQIHNNIVEDTKSKTVNFIKQSICTYRIFRINTKSIS